MNNDFNNNNSNNNNNSVNSPFVPDDLLVLVKKDNNVNNTQIQNHSDNSFVNTSSSSNTENQKTNMFFDTRINYDEINLNNSFNNINLQNNKQNLDKPDEKTSNIETDFNGKFFGFSNEKSFDSSEKVVDSSSKINNDKNDLTFSTGSDKMDFLIGKRPDNNLNNEANNSKFNINNNPVSLIENSLNQNSGSDLNNNTKVISNPTKVSGGNASQITDFLVLVNHDNDKKTTNNFGQNVINNVNSLPVQQEEDIHTLPQAQAVVHNEEEKTVDVSDFLMKNVYNANVDREIRTKNENKVFLTMSITLGSVFVVILIFIVLSTKGVFNFAAGEAYYENKSVEYIGEYQTAVVTDNMYKNVSIKSDDDAKELIKKDSQNQKDKCDNEKTKKVELDIEEKYGIVATNFCEMDDKFAKEIEKVIGVVYKEFPSIKGYLTNLTIVNAPEDINYIASFVSAKLFAKSNTRNSFPNVYKMSIMLNSQYFLNTSFFKEVVKSQASNNYFPKNATPYSLVAHEFGHYMSFLAQLNNTKGVGSTLLINNKNYNAYYNLVKDSNDAIFSKKMIDEAFDNYKKKSSKFRSEYEFRNSISEYAVAVDNLGNDLYDETIAEAFHDYYVNRKKAKPASLEIVEVLKKYLNN